MALGWEEWWYALVAFGAAFGGGGMNALAGGGTILTFPTLLALGIPPVGANVTSAVALWPSGLGGAWGFRREVVEAERWWLWLGIPSAAGGALGAVLLLSLPSEVFAAIAPYLVLAATLIIAFQDRIEQLVQGSLGRRQSIRRRVIAIATQLVVATYGGYFGAGLGILVLTALGLFGVGDIHQAEGLKNIFVTAIKGVAVIIFILTAAVVWQAALLMVVGAILGGYLAAAWGHRIDERALRWTVVAIGIGMTVVMFIQLGA